MKKLLSFLTLCLSMSAQGQGTYHKFLNNSEWCVVTYTQVQQYYTTYWETSEDTLINQLVWTKVANNRNSSIIPIYEDTIEKIVLRNSPSPISLIYDFSGQVGQTCYIGVVDTIIPFSTPLGSRNRYFIENLPYSYIEGIGALSNPFRPYPELEIIHYLVGATQNNQLTYIDTLHDISNCELHYLITSSPTVLPDRVLISPNPFSDFTTIDIGTPQRQLTTLTLFDMSGRMIKTTSANGSKFQLQRDGLPSGYYLLQCTLDDGSMVNKKLIVK